MSMDPGIAIALRELGPTLDLRAVHALYAPLLSKQSRDGVDVHLHEPYGEHHRQRLDVYTCGEAHGRPVLVWLHGGGFIGGEKQHRANIGFWAAREGYLAVLPNYRLAPEVRWPSGAHDVVAVWRWLRAHAARFGGDPDRIVLAGESAGAAHVAAAVLMRCFQPNDWKLAGAALLSGPYDPHLERLARQQFGIATPDPRNDAYFGPDPTTWTAASIVDRADASPFPLWIAFAERDLLQMQVQAGALFARLVTHLGFAPDLQLLREHNHFSSGYSLGTDDSSVSERLSAFLHGCAG